jgi:abortive infection bacteriophage resistance protein
MDVAKTITERRTMIYQYLDQIRYLRNRIAHHEPIFNRALADDYHKIIELVRFRCEITASWLSDNQTALETIAKKP